MIETLLWLILLFTAAILVFAIVSFLRGKNREGTQIDLQSELRAGREESRSAGKELREEVSQSIQNTSKTMSSTLGTITQVQQKQLETMSHQLREIVESNRKELEKIRLSVEHSVKGLQESNEKKLEEMRKTVDEKLHHTLEKRLGESFKLVSDRLDAVHKGLGEMQNLATGVGDLQRVLTNVKARGTWAEYQLEALLDQVLTKDQFGKNVAVCPESSERVEFAICLPGQKDEPSSHIWLPVDSKFPQEDYVRLQDAADGCDTVAVKSAVDALSRAVRNSAKDISRKYVHPPYTTDFAIMFLATEGLYAEVIRQPVLVEELQQSFHIIVAGPSTLVALLNSLRMGFQTLAIEKRASEVWKVLGAVKTEFGKFGQTIDRVKKQLVTVSRSIDDTGRRTRVLQSKLTGVESLPDDEASEILSLPVDNSNSIDDESLK